ncbi:hypothetical protein [Salinibius halmophilus]|uniref:hypothetical protein n=1 Tax=Salinibius halmophilus TaxID=1853216 RepID=UPI001314B4EC|nr:hypothetical protein [Salinibius halmophilus]
MMKPWLMVASCLILVACSPVNVVPVDNPVSSPTPVQATPLASASVTILPTTIPLTTPSVTPIATPTPTATPTVTPTATPTASPLVSTSPTVTPAANLTIQPLDGASNIGRRPTLSVSSDQPLAELTVQATSGTCAGNLQLSANSFATCIGLQATGEQSWLPVEDLQLGRMYQVRVLNATTQAGATIDSTEQSFTTSQQSLLINEVSESYYNNISRWVELHNPTATGIQLADYQLRAPARNSATNTYASSHLFALPDYYLPPGGYVMLRAPEEYKDINNGSTYVYVSDANLVPNWYTQGFVELLREGKTEDFVSFGANYTPTTAGAWLGDPAAAFVYGDISYMRGLARLAGDTNTADDWQLVNYTTPSAVNDVSCSADTDSDGIPDCSEQPGSSFAGLPLYDWAARVGQPDIFIEVDYMDATNGGQQAEDLGLVPSKEALQMVVDAFAKKGIAVHIDVGDLYDQSPGVNPSNFDLGGGQQVPFERYVGLSNLSSEQANFYDYKASYFDIRRLYIFHYALFANQRNSQTRSSGVAEINGNDLIVTVGENGLSTSTDANRLYRQNFQALTLMHELGHNLGLRHGD